MCGDVKGDGHTVGHCPCGDQGPCWFLWSTGPRLAHAESDCPVAPDRRLIKQMLLSIFHDVNCQPFNALSPSD
jgi:hypothetical protein